MSVEQLNVEFGGLSLIVCGIVTHDRVGYDFEFELTDILLGDVSICEFLCCAYDDKGIDLQTKVGTLACEKYQSTL